MIFVVEMECVFWEVGTEFINIIGTSFVFVGFNEVPRKILSVYCSLRYLYFCYLFYDMNASRDICKRA
jgi:hypothetical protein